MTPEEIENLKNQLESKDKEIARLKSKEVVVQTNTSQENFITTLIKEGAPFVMEYLNANTETSKYSLDKECELEKEELKIIDKLDTKEKIYKGVLLCVCLSAPLVLV